jgi:hypothetical protein
VVFWAEVYGQAPATLGVEEMREVAREEIERHLKGALG